MADRGGERGYSSGNLLKYSKLLPVRSNIVGIVAFQKNFPLPPRVPGDA